jgi:choline kinase
MDGAMRMIVLAAGQGTRLRPLTDDRPKCLVELAGRPLLEWTLQTAHGAGIDDVVVVGGYRIDRLRTYPTRLLANPDFATTNMVRTLFSAEGEFGDAFVMSYGDIAYTRDVLGRLLASDGEIAVAVDRAWYGYWRERFDDPLSDAETLDIDADGFITDIGRKPASLADIKAQYIGLVLFRGRGVEGLRDAYQAARAQDAAGGKPFGGPRSLDGLYMTDLLQGLIGRGARLKAVEIYRGWVEIDSARDLAVAERIVGAGGLGPRP